MSWSRWFPAAALLGLAAVLPAQESVNVPYARFLDLYRAAGVVHEPSWSDVREHSADYRGKVLSYQVVVKGRIDSASESRLIAYTRHDEAIMVVVPGGGTNDLGRWYGVLGRLPDDGSTAQLIAVAITEIRSPMGAGSSVTSAASGTDAAVGGGQAAGSATPAALAPLPQAGPPPGGAPTQSAVPPQMTVQTQQAAAPVNDSAAVAKLERFIAYRNSRVGPAERHLMANDIVGWARYHGMRWEFFAAVITVESNFTRTAVSRSGAMGLGQLMPFNCTRYGVTDPFDIRQNLRGAAQHLREFLDRYRQRSAQDQFQLTLACYNAGPGAVARYGGVPPYGETLAYIRQVAAVYVQLCGGT